MTFRGSVPYCRSRVPIISDFRSKVKSVFRQKSTFRGHKQEFTISMLLAIELALLCQICDLHFKFEEYRTKTAVAIQSDRYSFGQTYSSTDFILCPMPITALDRQNLIVSLTLQCKGLVIFDTDE